MNTKPDALKLASVPIFDRSIGWQADATATLKEQAAEIETLRSQLEHWKTFAIHAEGEHAAWKKTATELDEELRAENTALKRDLQYARDGLTKGRARMREDTARLAEALRDMLAAHAMRASCQAGMVDRCKCVPCATGRARKALGPNG